MKNTFTEEDLSMFRESIRQVMAEVGITFEGDYIPDGSIHRFDIDRPGDNAGWYCYHLDNLPTCIFGNWKEGGQHVWSAKDQAYLSLGEQKALASQIEHLQQIREVEKAQRNEAARVKARKLWDEAKPASEEHPYLKKKDVKPYGIRVNGVGNLLVPLYDASGSIQNIQFIMPDGTKRFLPGGAVSGNFSRIPREEQNFFGNEHLYLCEGFATAASIHEATGGETIIAFNAQNVAHVAKKINSMQPGRYVVVCADNDQWTDGNPGIAKAKSAAQILQKASLRIPEFENTSTKPTDFNDLHKLEGLDTVYAQLVGRAEPTSSPLSSSLTPEQISAEWARAKDLFPKTPFPWQVLPLPIAESLKQLARSCATSPTALPGVAMAILASVLGSTVSVSPKRSWEEPLILWTADIRKSGEGKTPAARALCKKLYAAQKKADMQYELDLADWQSQPPKARGPEPKRARGYFVTDLTLEGIRADVSGHGGCVCIMDELSGFINSQNQYRSGKGSDREAWLSLHDGKPARLVRAGKSRTITGARISLTGGVQPAVFRSVFGGEDGLFIVDGTIFRLLMTFESEKFFPLTAEPWDQVNQAAWEDTLSRAMRWADEWISNEDWKTHQLILSEEAQTLFFDWRNDLYAEKPGLPDLVKGFLPKATGYALRLAGILHCLERFSNNRGPADVLSTDDIQRGITVVTFYMGHIVDAMQLLLTENHEAEIEITEQTRHLVTTLETLKPELDNGLLAIGYIREKFDATCQSDLKLNARAMGALLTSLGLTKSASKKNANGRRGVYCLVWDEKTEILIRKVRESSNNEVVGIAGTEDEQTHPQTSQTKKTVTPDIFSPTGIFENDEIPNEVRI